MLDFTLSQKIETVVDELVKQSVVKERHEIRVSTHRGKDNGEEFFSNMKAQQATAQIEMLQEQLDTLLKKIK